MTTQERSKKANTFKYASTLTSSQRATLKGMAHHLKPVIQVGGQGLTDSVAKEVTAALNIHELIKIQLPGQTKADEKSGITDELTPRLPPHTHVVARIGRNVILFQEKDPEEAKIRLKELK